MLTPTFSELADDVCGSWGGYVGYVEELPGANTQGRTLAEVRTNLVEAVELVLEANREQAEEALVGQNAIR